MAVEPITKTSQQQPPANQGGDPPPREPGSEGGDPPARPVRPDGFGESLSSYWNDDTGADYAKLTEDMASLSALKAEQESRSAQVPSDLNEYEVGLPDGFQLPEGVTFEVIADDPIIPIAREFAQKAGLTKDGFKDLVGVYAQAKLAEDTQLKTRVAEEKTKLGTKADARIDAVNAWAKATLGEKHAAAIMPMMFTAASIEAFEAVMQIAKGGGSKPNGGGRETDQPKQISAEEWARLTPQQRIERNRQLAAAG